MANGWSMAWGEPAGGGDADEGADGAWAPLPASRHAKSDNEVPAVVAIEQVLAATDDLVFFLAGLRVYSSGVEFDLEARLRPGAQLGDVEGIWEVLGGHRSHERLLLGVEFADGRRGSNLEVRGNGVSLASSGSGGGARAAQATYFLSPLPPPGDVRIYCALPGAGIREAVSVLDAAQILEAAQRVRELWPWEPESYRDHRPAAPSVPDGGWFASLRESPQ